MKNIFWKAYLYGPAAVLLSLIIYVGGIKFENLNGAELVLLTALSGALSGYFHVYILMWDKSSTGAMHQRIMRNCLIYRPPLAMGFALVCYFWLYYFFLYIRERFPPLAPVIVSAIALLLGSFSYWLIKLLVKIVSEILKIKESLNKQNKEILYNSKNGDEIMETQELEKKEFPISQSLKERIIASDGYWEWIKVILLGFFLLIIPVILVFFIIDFWPVKNAANTWSNTTMIMGFQLSFHLRMLLLVLLAGALGSYIHVATSFSYHIARRDYEPHWYWWYWMRLPVGATLALVFIMIIEGGLFVVSTSYSDSTPITTIGVAALIGLFSRHALEKLRDIFDVVFNPRDKK
jgi:hypothetical protein